jgi:hypothetical protein
LLAECTSNQPEETMTAEPILSSDIIGLTRTAPLSRRGFMTASAATAAGYTLAAGPVRADAIKTDTELPQGCRRRRLESDAGLVQEIQGAGLIVAAFKRGARQQRRAAANGQATAQRKYHAGAVAGDLKLDQLQT